jgi:hypothetical protein
MHDSMFLRYTDQRWLKSHPRLCVGRRGNQQINSISFQFAAACDGAGTPMRLRASHGRAHSHIFDNRYSSEPCNGYWSHHRKHEDIAKTLPCAMLLSLLKPSVDVLRQYSLPNMDLRTATHSAITLRPKHNDICSSPLQLSRVRCHRLASASWSFCRCDHQ